MGTVLRAAALLVALAAALVTAVSAAAALAPEGMFALGRAGCALPCWQGIVPGVTTVEEAERLLRDSPFVAPGSVRWWTEEDSSGFMQWRMADAPPRPQNVAQGRIWHGVVVALRIPGTHHRLGDIVRAFGQPSWVMAQYIDSGKVLADLVYTEQGMRVLSLGTSGRQLSPDLPVVEVVYLQSARPRQGWSRPWQGFALARYLSAETCGAC